ncbi:hypothetical protein GQX73_g6088 [Xylaria multiplex]|uniref:Peptidase S8/S53 domain-containing protein n=1 Tax=Xylaria multiplex TaxID=323545 RepID=A0A7C8IN84_9PEZI|nr:hypothetical protein GQX73_g6088 [Xylaria multiplex]
MSEYQEYHLTPSQTNEGTKRDIAFMLKDQIMHLPDRDKVLSLLYGRRIDPESTEKNTTLPESDGFEREIHLDLRELQMPKASSRPSPTDVVENKPSKDGTGRRDFKEIFDVLETKRVRKIHRLVVDDDDAYPHQDEIIETLSRFEIEEFQWNKMDLSSSVLCHAVPYVQTLRLFSSGNHSVLRDWSSVDGLNQLGLLRSVYLKIYWKTESRARIEQYAKDFISRMVTNLPKLQVVEIRLESFTTKHHEEWPNRHLLVTTNKWLQTMQKFATFVNNVQKLAESESEKKEVRVAILDDGIDWSFASEIGCCTANSTSFYPDKRIDFECHNSWFSSSTDHGTLMAALIQKICPGVTLYIARLDQTESEQGEFQPTPDSAAKAIDWAVQKGVHIISMSWTIPGEHLRLKQAVEAAHKQGILMFGSASDQGAKSSDKPYMAKLADDGKGPVICIGGARDFGLADERARSEGEFFFPGQTKGIPAPLPPLKSNFGTETGSSVATALAAGLIALIMLLVDMSTKYNSDSKSAAGYRAQLQDPMNIRLVFRDLLRQSEIHDQNNELRKKYCSTCGQVLRGRSAKQKASQSACEQEGTERKGVTGRSLETGIAVRGHIRVKFQPYTVLIQKHEDKKAIADSEDEADQTD